MEVIITILLDVSACLFVVGSIGVLVLALVADDKENEDVNSTPDAHDLPRWIRITPYDGKPYMCSACKEEFYETSERCPNCGRKMLTESL